MTSFVHCDRPPRMPTSRESWAGSVDMTNCTNGSSPVRRLRTPLSWSPLEAAQKIMSRTTATLIDGGSGARQTCRARTGL